MRNTVSLSCNDLRRYFQRRKRRERRITAKLGNRSLRAGKNSWRKRRTSTDNSAEGTAQRSRSGRQQRITTKYPNYAKICSLRWREEFAGKGAGGETGRAGGWGWPRLLRQPRPVDKKDFSDPLLSPIGQKAAYIMRVGLLRGKKINGAAMTIATADISRQAVRGADRGTLPRKGPIHIAVSRQSSRGEGCQLPVGAHSYSIKPYSPPGPRTTQSRVS